MSGTKWLLVLPRSVLSEQFRWLTLPLISRRIEGRPTMLVSEFINLLVAQNIDHDKLIYKILFCIILKNITWIDFLI
jgi:hypothetical protein